MIFLRAVRQIMEPVDNAMKVPFTIEVFKKSGELVAGKGLCTSSCYRTNTFNMQFIPSGEIRKFHFHLIRSINGKEVML